MCVNLVSTTTVNFPIDKSRDLSSIPVSSSLRTAEAESLLQTLHFLQVCLLQVFSVFYKRAFCRSSCHFQVFSVFYKRAFYRSCRFLQAFRSCHAFYRSAHRAVSEDPIRIEWNERFGYCWGYLQAYLAVPTYLVLFRWNGGRKCV